MKKIVSLLVLILTFSLHANAQKKIQVTKFEKNVTSLIGSMNQVEDNTGEACAVLRVRMPDNIFEIEPNLGIVKKETKTGELLLWIPVGTKRLTVRHYGVMPLAGYEIPFRLEPKVTYDAEVEIVEYTSGSKGKSYEERDYHVFVGAGYNVTAISGPSAMIGLDYKHHMIEVGAVFGLNKTDDMYFYNSDGNLNAAYNYQAFRVSLRYGYNLGLSDIFSLTPQLGAAYNSMSGTAIKNGNSNSSYQSTSSISGIAAVRVMAKLSKQIGLYVTPEYDFGLSKEDICKLIGENDKTFMSWTEGFNLNVGVMISF